MTDRSGTQLETLLRAAADASDMNGITSIINSMTETEKSEVRFQIYDYVFMSIANYSVHGAGDTSTDALAASTARNFMVKVGSFVTGDAISNAMVTLSADHNLNALDAVTDYLTQAQKNAMPSNRIDDTLGNIVSYSNMGGASNTSTNTVTATAIRDLMVKLGTVISGGALSSAMITLSADHNLAALDAVTDYLTPSQKTAIPRTSIDQTLVNIALYSAEGGAADTSTNTVTANAIRDLLVKLGIYVSGDVIGYAMTTLSADHNLAGLDAVTDYLTAAQKAVLNPAIIGQALNNVALYSAEGGVGNTSMNSATAVAIRDLMVKLGASISGNDIGKAMVTLSADHNFTALDAVTDYLTSTQKSSIPVASIDTVVRNLANHSYTGYHDDGSTNAEATNVIRDFMSKLGAFASGAVIGEAMATLSNDLNFAALDAVTDFLTSSQKSSIPAFYIDTTLTSIALYSNADGALGTGNNAAATDAIRDLMTKLGTFASGAAIGTTIDVLASDRNFAALDAATDYLTAAQKSAIPRINIDSALNSIALYSSEGGASNTSTNAASANALRDLMGKVGTFASGAAINNAMVTFAIDHNLAALDAVTDYLTLDQKSAITMDNVNKSLFETALYSSTGGTFLDTDLNQNAANAIRDLMEKFGSLTNKTSLSTDISILVNDNNLMGVSAILDNASDDFTKYIKDDNASAFSVRAIRVLMDTNDTYNGSEVSDIIFSRGGSDIVHGNEGYDTLYGGNGNDTLYGDAMDDILNGGAGTDILFGGTGGDTFIFELPPSSGVDTIGDFNATSGDKLDFSNLLSNFDPVTNAITDFITQTTVSGNTTISIDADGKGAGAAVAVVTLNGVDHIDIQNLFSHGQIIA